MTMALPDKALAKWMRRHPRYAVGSLQRYARDLTCPTCGKPPASLTPDYPLTPSPLAESVPNEQRHIYWRCEEEHNVHTRAIHTVGGWRLDSWIQKGA